MKNLLIPAALAFTLSACATNTSQPAPTHRWASASIASEAQYQLDHARCESQSQVSKTKRAYAGETEQFEAYKACMVSSGYELTAYRDNKHQTH